jgi:hypothetical protein
LGRSKYAPAAASERVEQSKQPTTTKKLVEYTLKDASVARAAILPPGVSEHTLDVTGNIKSPREVKPSSDCRCAFSHIGTSEHSCLPMHLRQEEEAKEVAQWALTSSQS